MHSPTTSRRPPARQGLDGAAPGRSGALPPPSRLGSPRASQAPVPTRRQPGGTPGSSSPRSARSPPRAHLPPPGNTGTTSTGEGKGRAAITSPHCCSRRPQAGRDLSPRSARARPSLPSAERPPPGCARADRPRRRGRGKPPRLEARKESQGQGCQRACQAGSGVA